MKISRNILFVAVLVFVLGTVACNRRPDGVLSKEKMAQLLADIHTGESVVDANSRTFNNDSVKRVFKQSIYAKHGVTPAEVDSSLKWYGYHMEKYIEVYDRVIEILDERVVKAQEIAGATGADVSNVELIFDGDSVDVWPLQRYRRLSAEMPADFITFNIHYDHNWLRGDAYLFKSKFIGLQNPVYVTLVADYNDGSKGYVSRTFNGDGWHEVKLFIDSARIAQNIYGTIYYTPGPGAAYIDSISLMRTRWDGHYRDQLELQHSLVRKNYSSR